MSGGGACGRAVIGMIAVALGVTSSFAKAESVVYRCEPAISHYCQNIHIGCAGRSKRKTTPFEVHIDGSLAVLRRGDKSNGVMMSKKNGEIVLRDPETGNWVRILKNRTYAERLQSAKPALMARGDCETVR